MMKYANKQLRAQRRLRLKESKRKKTEKPTRRLLQIAKYGTDLRLYRNAPAAITTTADAVAIVVHIFSLIYRPNNYLIAV